MTIPNAPTMKVAAGAPTRDNIVGGTATADGATILTIPADRIWRGTVTLSAGHTHAIGAAGATYAPSVDVVGAGALPAPGVLVRIRLAVPVTTATATTGAGDGKVVTVPNVIVSAPAGNSVTLVLRTASASNVGASAIGELL